MQLRRFFRLLFLDDLPYLFLFVSWYLAEGAVLFARRLTLLGGEFAPCTQAAEEALFFFGTQVGIVAGDGEQTALLFLR